mgnify:CR=1 FL=1
MYWYKNPLVQQYPIRIRLVTIGVLMSFALMAYIFPRTIDNDQQAQNTNKKAIDDFEAPPITQQIEQIKPPPRPSVPIASEDDEFDMDISIEDTDLDKYNGPRQDFPEVLIPNGYVDILKGSYIREESKLHGNKVLAFETPFCNEVDAVEELDLIEFQLNKNGCPLTKYLEKF